MHNSKKGFTLIEILAIIVILSIIFSISIPKVLDVIEKSRRRIFLNGATSIVSTVKTHYSQNLYNKKFEYKVYEFDKTETSGYKQNSEKLKLKGDLPSVGTVKLNEQGEIALAVVSHDERYCAKKSYSDAEVTVEDYILGTCNLEVDGIIIGEELKINIVAEPSTWSRSKDVTITHNAGDRAKLQYQIGTLEGEWIDYNNNFILEENTTIYARLYKGNNSIESSLTVTTIDREGPIITYSKEDVTTKSAKVYFTVTDSKSGVDTSSITCKYGNNKDGTVAINGNSVTCTMPDLKNNTEYNYKISAKDKLGNESSRESSVTTGDFSSIAIAATSTGNVSGVWSTSKQITISSSLPTGTKLQYQLGTTTGAWTDYSNPFELTSNTTIYARVTDDKNVSKTANHTVTTIDRIEPTTPTLVNSSGGNWTNQNVTVTASSTDIGSGVAYWQYSYDTINWYIFSNGSVNLWNTEVQSPVYVRAVDYVGNVSGISQTGVYIDKTPPTTPTLVNSSGGNWTNQNVTVTASSTDSLTYVASYQYSYDTINWYIFSNGSVNLWNTEVQSPVYVRAVDYVGNVSEISQTGIYIDRTPPTMWMRIDKNPAADSSQAPVTLTAWAQDNGSGVKEFKYWQSNKGGWFNNWNPNTFSYEDGWYVIRDNWTEEGAYTIWIIACDNVGNCTTDSNYTRPAVNVNIASSSSNAGSSGGSTSKPTQSCKYVEMTDANVSNCTAKGGKLCASGSSSSCLASSQNTPKCYKWTCK